MHDALQNDVGLFESQPNSRAKFYKTTWDHLNHTQIHARCTSKRGRTVRIRAALFLTNISSNSPEAKQRLEPVDYFSAKFAVTPETKQRPDRRVYRSNNNNNPTVGRFNLTLRNACGAVGV